MDTSQVIGIIVLAPLFFIYGANELHRGWKILKLGEYSPNIAIQMRVWLIRLFFGTQKSDEYELQIKNDPSLMRRKGIYSLAGGLAAVAVSIFWMWLLYASTI